MNQAVCLAILLPVLLSVPALSFSESDEVQDNMYKFDDGFYEKIQHMQNMTSHGRADSAGNATLAAHSVIIVTDDGYEDRLEQTLREMGSRDIFKSRSLDFLIADVPVNRITDLAGYDHVYKLGDGHGELTSSASPSRLPTALTLAQAKAVVGATNVGSDAYPYTGQEITVGLIGTGTDFTHPDLQNKNAASLLCTQLQCINASLLAGTNRATSTSAVIASNSTNPAMAGMAPDSMIHDARLAGVTHVGESSAAKNTFARALDEMVTQLSEKYPSQAENQRI